MAQSFNCYIILNMGVGDTGGLGHLRAVSCSFLMGYVLISKVYSHTPSIKMRQI